METKIAICSAIKDEQRNIGEWIEHNLAIGICAIHLYEDEGSTSHEEIVGRYPNVYLHALKECPRTDYTNRDWKQVDMMRHFISSYSYDWVAFIDPDEYIRLEEGWTLERVCREYRDCHAVYMQYRIIGASGHITRPSAGIQESYSNHDAEYAKQKSCFKSLCNLRKNPVVQNCHKIKCGFFTNGSNAFHGISRAQIWLDHYYTKSWEDWCWRFFDRGDIVPGNVKVEEFFIYNHDIEPRKEELLEAFHKERYRRNIEKDFSLGEFSTGDKKLLFIGNKPQKVTCGDEYIVRYNKMDNAVTRMDAYMLFGVADDFVEKVKKENLDAIHNAPIIYVNRQWYDYFGTHHRDSVNVLLPQRVMHKVVFWSDSEVIEGLGLRYTADDMEHLQSAVRAILFLLWRYKDYHITITAVDMERSFLSNDKFHHLWQEEERILNYLAKNHFIEIQ